jgi:hypothetical protein
LPAGVARANAAGPGWLECAVNSKVLNGRDIGPAYGRPVVCRRQGCAEPASDAVVQLCAGHRAAYEHGKGQAIAEAGKPGRRARV